MKVIDQETQTNTIDKLKRIMSDPDGEFKKELEKNHAFVIENNLLNELRERVKNHIILKQRHDATEVVVEEIKNTNKIYSTRDDEKSEMWIYREGIYIPNGESYIREFCRFVFGIMHTQHLTNEVIDKIRADTYIDSDKFFTNDFPNLLPVQNGIIDTKEKKLLKFSVEYKFFNKLPVKYRPGADCPAIKKFFTSLFKDDSDVKVIKQLFGFTLIKDYFIEKSAMFTGTGRNGKSKTIELLKRFLGVDNCCNVGLQDLTQGGFYTSELMNKMANLSPDLPANALKESGIFKSATGHDMLTAYRKFKNSLHFENYAKMFFCCNELPKTYDKTVSFFSRWIIIDFPFTFLTNKEIENSTPENLVNVKICDTEIINKISTPQELSGLLNWALEGLHELLKIGDFSYSKSTAEVKESWLRKSDSVEGYIIDAIIESPESEILKSEFRRSYVNYCRKHRLKIQSEKSLTNTLTNELPVSERRSHNDKYWVGIQIKPEFIEEGIDVTTSEVATLAPFANGL